MDDSDSLLFREVLPDAAIVAFEANPINFGKITANPVFAARGIQVVPYAASNQRGTAAFHITDVNYDQPSENRGTSSLLVHEGLKVKQTVEVETWRLDEFLIAHQPQARRVGLWIDVEGAEYAVIEGIAGVKDRIIGLHVETARRPYRVGQKVYADVEGLMQSLGFVPVATNMSRSSDWGDVLFVRADVLAGLGWRFGLSRWVGAITNLLRIDALAAGLKTHCRPLHQLLWRIYVKLFG
jgi:FkbM family methyltransferase